MVAVLGKNCILVAQSGISGSTHIGNNVIIGGQVGIAGHLKIGDYVPIIKDLNFDKENKYKLKEKG